MRREGQRVDDKGLIMNFVTMIKMMITWLLLLLLARHIITSTTPTAEFERCK